MQLASIKARVGMWKSQLGKFTHSVPTGLSHVEAQNRKWPQIQKFKTASYFKLKLKASTDTSKPIMIICHSLLGSRNTCAVPCQHVYYPEQSQRCDWYFVTLQRSLSAVLVLLTSKSNLSAHHDLDPRER